MNLAPASEKRSEFVSDDYIVSFADVEVNLDRALVTRRNVRVVLTTAEFELLTFFVQNPDKPLTRDMILESVWSYLPSPNTRTVDAHVLRLRQKLEAEPEVPQHFLTVHKVGYRFSPGGPQ
jgi:DNA-binding response OmpR family regulator